MLLDFNFSGKNFGVKILFQFFLNLCSKKLYKFVKNKIF